MANTAPTGVTPTATPTATLDPATLEKKADAKAATDATVATDPSAIHAPNSLPLSKKSLSSAAVGAGVGFMMAGPPGALVGGGIGWLVEKYRIAGGPVGKAMDVVEKKVAAAKAKAAAKPAGQ